MDSVIPGAFFIAPDTTPWDAQEAYREFLFGLVLTGTPADVIARAREATTTYARFREETSAELILAGTEVETNGEDTPAEKNSARRVWSTHRLPIEGTRSASRASVSAMKRRLDEARTQHADDPTDGGVAVSLVEVALDAQCERDVSALLLDARVVAIAPALLIGADLDASCTRLVKWSDVLVKQGRADLATQLLEDARLVVSADSSIATLALIGLLYSRAQGYTSTTGGKPPAAERIQQLERLIKLGKTDGYVFKLLAQARLDSGDREQAGRDLKKAFAIDPYLSGAVRISKALGISPTTTAQVEQARTAEPYRFRSLQEVPTTSEIRRWASRADWQRVIETGTLAAYSPITMSKARESMAEAAYQLRHAPKEVAEAPLLFLLECGLGNARTAAMASFARAAALASLARIGDEGTLREIRRFRVPASASSDHAAKEEAVLFLEARIKHSHTDPPGKGAAPSSKEALELWYRRRYVECLAMAESLLGILIADDEERLFVRAVAALSSAQIRDFEQAITVDRRLLERPWPLARLVQKGLPDWIQQVRSSEPYDREFDDDYLLVTDSLFASACERETLDLTLNALRPVGRWMETIGDVDGTAWFHALWDREMPGAPYSKDYPRPNNIRSADWSDRFRHEYVARTANYRSRVAASIVSARDRCPLELLQKKGTHAPVKVGGLNTPRLADVMNRALNRISLAKGRLIEMVLRAAVTEAERIRDAVGASDQVNRACETLCVELERAAADVKSGVEAAYGTEWKDVPMALSTSSLQENTISGIQRLAGRPRRRYESDSNESINLVDSTLEKVRKSLDSCVITTESDKGERAGHGNASTVRLEEHLRTLKNSVDSTRSAVAEWYQEPPAKVWE